jgi:hypothetical protein
MVGRESPGSLAFIRILVLVKSGQKSACSTMPGIFTPYWSLFTLYNNKTFCYSSTVKWSIYIYLSSKRYKKNLTLSIILSPSHTSTDLGVGGGSAGQPRRVFALLQVIGEGENLRLPRHQGRNRINRSYVADPPVSNSGKFSDSPSMDFRQRPVRPVTQNPSDP